MPNCVEGDCEGHIHRLDPPRIYESCDQGSCICNGKRMFIGTTTNMIKTNKKGWQTKVTFEERMKVFAEDLIQAGVQKPVILELDGHVTRYSLATFEFCLQQGM